MLAIPTFAQSYLIANGTYTIASKNSGEVIDVTGASTTEGTDLEQWALTGNANQQWKLTNLGSNYVSLINVNSGLAMEVYGASTVASTKVDQWPYNSGKNQIWQVVSKGSGYYELINENSGQALDVNGDSTTEGAAIDQYTISGNANQLWSFTEVGGSTGCTSTPITPYIYANGAWTEETSASVASGAGVDLGPQPVTGGSW
ncbi:MAG: RICIN domain-containing protein, partial [Terracidiphilus sp.]